MAAKHPECPLTIALGLPLLQPQSLIRYCQAFGLTRQLSGYDDLVAVVAEHFSFRLEVDEAATLRLLGEAVRRGKRDPATTPVLLPAWKGFNDSA